MVYISAQKMLNVTQTRNIVMTEYHTQNIHDNISEYNINQSPKNTI